MPKFETFKGRQRELKLMDELWESPDATLLVLYGRRRVGKTRLLKQWIEQRANKTAVSRALYWVAAPSSAADQLRSFSQAIYNFANPNAVAPLNFSYVNWRQAWQQVAKLAQNERFALFVDEFTHVLAITPGAAGTLQNAWDHILSRTNLFLVISGSHQGMMQRHMLSYKAPFYGRATRQLLLRPIPFGNTQDFLPTYSSEERVSIYAIFGGIPAYWERIEPTRSIADNIYHQLLTPDNLMQAEPRLLLQDFVSEPHNYVSILRAIGSNAQTQKEISIRTGLAQGHVSKYLSVLRESGFVERRVPITANENSRMGRYYIMDPYLRFYYRFLFSRQAQLAMGESDLAFKEISEHLLKFIGASTWEEICREWILRASVRGVLPFVADQVGSVWSRREEVDVVGINRIERTIFLGACQWQTELGDVDLLETLVAKSERVVPNVANWQLCYLGFAKEGWTEAAQAYAETVTLEMAERKNWQVRGMKLVNLAQLDHDLHVWSRT